MVNINPMSDQNMQIKSGMSFKINTLEKRLLLFPFAQRWKLESRYSGLGTGDSKMTNEAGMSFRIK